MTTYQVRISEDYSEYYEVEADSEEEALDKVNAGIMTPGTRKTHKYDTDVYEI